MHKLAIIVPYYKIDYFEKTLKSLKSQSNRNFALYIGNDASPVDPLPLIGKYFSPGEYGYFHYADNLGAQNLASQWARILENVSEEWFQILGDDDFLSPNFVEEFYRNFTRLGDSMSAIKVKTVMCDGEGKITKQLYNRYTTGFYSSLDFMIAKFRGRLNSSLSEHIFRRAKYQQVGFADYELAWHTDDMHFLQASDFGDFLFIVDACVYVRLYEGSISGSHRNLDRKRSASQLFFNDLSSILSVKGISPWKRILFLRSLRNNKALLGSAYIKEIYQRNGRIGRVYYGVYSLQLFIKRFIPENILRRIQTGAVRQSKEA